MTKKKLLVGVAALVAAVALVGPSFAESPAFIPKDPSGARFADPSFLGLSVGRVSGSTTPVLGYAGQGLLFGICSSSGTADEFAVAFDSASISGLSWSETAKLISPHVSSPGLAGGTDQSNTRPCWSPPGGYPVRFQNGLVVAASKNDIQVVFYYLKDQGANPPN